jgi:Ankyrin repeats (3 copies)/Ankyrin repeat
LEKGFFVLVPVVLFFPISPNFSSPGVLGTRGLSPHEQFSLAPLSLNEMSVKSQKEELISLMTDCALHAAIGRGDIKVVRSLIRKGTNLNEPNVQAQASPLYRGKSPLHLAVFQDEFEIGSLLLKHGADPQQIDSRGNTPLMLAAQGANQQFLSLLIAANVDINQENLLDKRRMTALFYAIPLGHLKAAHSLLEHGARTKNGIGLSVLRVFCIGGDMTRARIEQDISRLIGITKELERGLTSLFPRVLVDLTCSFTAGFHLEAHA